VKRDWVKEAQERIRLGESYLRREYGVSVLTATYPGRRLWKGNEFGGKIFWKEKTIEGTLKLFIRFVDCKFGLARLCVEPKNRFLGRTICCWKIRHRQKILKA